MLELEKQIKLILEIKYSTDLNSLMQVTKKKKIKKVYCRVQSNAKSFIKI